MYVEDIMGKGDKKTRRGKIYRGSHGNTRPHGIVAKAPASKTAKTATARKTTRKRKSA